MSGATKRGERQCGTAQARSPDPNWQRATSLTRQRQEVNRRRGFIWWRRPIGNLDDITLRALKLLRGADLIACEDTRVTGKLLSLLGLAAPALTPYHEHNAERARPALLARLREGAVVALVSDAGTPLVSDPGYRLVRACLADGLPVTSLPGPSAALTALQLSGLPCDRFLFAGFLPVKAGSPAQCLGRAGGGAGQPALLRIAAPAGRKPRRHGRRPGPARRRRGARADQALRRGAPRQSGRAGAALRRRRSRPRAKWSSSSARRQRPPAASRGRGRQSAASGPGRRRRARDAAAAVAAATGLPKRQVYARAVALPDGRRDGDEPHDARRPNHRGRADKGRSGRPGSGRPPPGTLGRMAVRLAVCASRAMPSSPAAMSPGRGTGAGRNRHHRPARRHPGLRRGQGAATPRNDARGHFGRTSAGG